MKIRGQTVFSIQDRIERLSTKDPVTHCWNWRGSKRNGYGRMMVGSRSNDTRKSVSSHRASYEAYKGNIPEGFYVCHRCDNRKCVNPDHLWLGTHQDNIDDRERKGRNNHTRKLSDLDVITIHKLKGLLSSKEIAEKYGVGYCTIKDIWCGKSHHRFLPLPPQKKGNPNE